MSWLGTEGRLIVDRRRLVEALAQRLVECGVPIERITTAVPILHPHLDTSAVYWSADGETVERFWQMKPENFRMLENSALHVVYHGGGPVRCRITPEAQENEYTIVPDLREQGITDYLVLPAPFSDGTTKAMTFATKAPAGFAEEHVALLEATMPTLGMILEIQTLRRTAKTLLDTYVGAVAGERVLDGTIKRGMGETIRAVIWFCDLRGFTTLSTSLERDAMILLLNDYFGAMVEAVHQHGGEVLKFIGDAMLAIFPLSAGDDGAESAAAALAAAVAARESIAAVNAERAAAARSAIDFGIALHVGDVLYGNIGGDKRLDFTVIGPAVNFASRIEGLCARLGRQILLSADFAALGAAAHEPVGSFALKGIEGEQTLFAPA